MDYDLTVSTGGSATQPSQIEPPWTIRGLIASHKPVALAVAAALVVMVGLILVAVLGAKSGPVTDATTCTQWGSANVNKQHAYARLYVREHGPVPRWGAAPAMVINAIDAGCFQAYGEDVDDTTTVVQAISGDF
jgi:hypothetical protein